MHYYKRNIGDYHKKAGRLTMLQHGAYTLLMDACYDREKFPTRDEAIEWLWASSAEDIAAIDFVLGKFFIETNGVFVQKRIELEVENYTKNAETNRRIALEREQKRRDANTKRAQKVNGASTKHHLTTNQEPLTTNQEPVKDNSDKSLINHQQVVDCYHDVMPMLAKVAVVSDKRKTAIRNFFKKRTKELGYQFTQDNFRSYLEYIVANCKWMLHDRPNGAGGFWKAKNFDYILTDNCYIAVKEQRFDDVGEKQ